MARPCTAACVGVAAPVSETGVLYLLLLASPSRGNDRNDSGLRCLRDLHSAVDSCNLCLSRISPIDPFIGSGATLFVFNSSSYLSHSLASRRSSIPIHLAR